MAEYKQKLLLPFSSSSSSSSTIQEDDDSVLLMRRLFEQHGGIIQGHGIEFCFTNDSGDDNVGVRPSILFPRESSLLPCDNSHFYFDSYYFHHDSMTFYGRISFPNNYRRVVDNVVHDDNDGGGFGAGSFYYTALDCYIQFANSGQYIRSGELRWQYANNTTSSREEKKYVYPFDGSWEVCYQNNTTPFVIHVQSHTFELDDNNTTTTTTNSRPIIYRINIDENNQHLLCMEPLFSNRHPTYTSNIEVIVPEGEEIINIGEIITWTIIDSDSECCVQVWKRLTLSLEYSFKVVPITVGTFVYQKITATTDDNNPLGPRYNSNTVWGNTFCQGLCVGMASYHFMNTNNDTDSTVSGDSSNSTYQAYISYESPRTELWPPLDNGNAIPPRVPFRNIRWDVTTRTFQGDICWLDDYDTTWTNETKWSYTIVFDSTYSFISSGSVSRSRGGRPHQFGVDLIYINAALETMLRERMLQQQHTAMGGRSPSAYLDIVRQWRDNGLASTATLDMLGEVAMGVMDNRESMINFNL